MILIACKELHCPVQQDNCTPKDSLSLRSCGPSEKIPINRKGKCWHCNFPNRLMTAVWSKHGYYEYSIIVLQHKLTSNLVTNVSIKVCGYNNQILVGTSCAKTEYIDILFFFESSQFPVMNLLLGVKRLKWPLNPFALGTKALMVGSSARKTKFGLFTLNRYRANWTFWSDIWSEIRRSRWIPAKTLSFAPFGSQAARYRHCTICYGLDWMQKYSY